MRALRKSIPWVVVIVILLGGWGTVFAQDSPPPDVPVVIPSASRACTSFCLDNDGHAVFGTNFDNDDYDGLLFVNKRSVSKMAWETGPRGERARWTSQYGSVTFNLAGYQLAWAGMNEAGLMMSTMALNATQNPAPDERPPLVSPLWMQYVLDTCATVDEVLATDDDVRITEENVDHFLVCDRTAACAVIELLDGEMVIHTGADLPISALANRTYAESLGTWQAKVSEGAETTSPESLDRFMRAANRVRDFAPREAADAVDYAFETLGIVSSPRTRWSIVFDAENRAIHFRTWNHMPIRSLLFDDLDFSCQRPVRMTNIKAALDGNITADLSDYDHGLSVAHTVAFLKAWGDTTPEVQIELLLRMMEAFPCEEF
jgi:penicillin V acylase-like amidase (Ntn superfamily)